MRTTSNRIRISAAALALALTCFAFLTACTGDDMDDSPPESHYTQAEAYAPMEAAVAELVEVLPDFPGFMSRTWMSGDCTHNGEVVEGYTSVEISYSFAEETSLDALVRETYVDFLRQRWTDEGYDVHRDTASGSGGNYSLEARRDDGINFWYQVAGIVVLKVQSGCVPTSELSEIPYILPSGGVEPGGPTDIVGRYFPDGIPTEGASSAASDPSSPSS